MKPLVLFLPLLALPILIGCGESEAGSAPVTKVSAEQRAQDVSAEAERTVAWLEKLPAAERPAAVQRAPQIKSSLDAVTDPALRARIDALGLP